MRHTTAISWLFTPLAALTLAASAGAADTIDTIEGERYEGVKILKLEDDGVIVKHTRGIAKIPFYELDEATRSELGHTGEVKPPIHYKERPDSGLLADSDPSGVDPNDLDLDLDFNEAEESQAEQPAVRTKRSMTASPSKPIEARAASEKQVASRSVSTVRVSSVGASYRKPSSNPNEDSAYYESDTLFARGARGRHLLGLPIRDQVTTRYTPYGNYSYCGSSGHWYGYVKVVRNRLFFERQYWGDHRRWQRGR